MTFCYHLGQFTFPGHMYIPPEYSDCSGVLENISSGCSGDTVTLSVHEEGKMPICVGDGLEMKYQIKVANGFYPSPFVAWFQLNCEDDFAKDLTFDVIPLHYVFDKTSKKWIRRKRYVNIPIRVTYVSRFSVECFATRQLALSTKGPKSYAELRTVNGVICDTAHEAAVMRGLIYCPLENAKKRVNDVDLSGSPAPFNLRKAFVEMLVHGCVSFPRDTWDSFESQFLDHNNRKEALEHVQTLLSEYGYCLDDFNLPGIPVTSMI